MTLPKAEGLRERKKQQVRAALHRSALNLFATKGFAETSIDDIATAADVSRSTFFRYFPSKESVVFDGYEEAGEQFAGFLRNRPLDESPIDAFEASQQAQAEQADLARHRAVAKARERLMESDPTLRARHMEMAKRWEANFAVTFAERAGRDDPNDEDRVAATVCLAVSNRISEQWWASGGTLDPHELIRKEFGLLRNLLKQQNHLPG